MQLDFSPIFAAAFPLLAGAATTIFVSGLSILLGAMLGLAFSFLAVAQQESWSASLSGRAVALYVSLFRGTPLLTQLIIVFYVVPTLIGVDFTPLWAAILALTFNTAAFQCEIYRSGLKAIPPGQLEAARILGIGRWQARRRILVPQMLRIALPALVNEIVIIVKNSSLVSVIAVTDLSRVGQQIAAATFRPTEAYLAVAVVYLAMTAAIAALGVAAERRLARAY